MLLGVAAQNLNLVLGSLHITVHADQETCQRDLEPVFSGTVFEQNIISMIEFTFPYSRALSTLAHFSYKVPRWVSFCPDGVSFCPEYHTQPLFFIQLSHTYTKHHQPHSQTPLSWPEDQPLPSLVEIDLSNHYTKLLLSLNRWHISQRNARVLISDPQNRVVTIRCSVLCVTSLRHRLIGFVCCAVILLRTTNSRPQPPCPMES